MLPFEKNTIRIYMFYFAGYDEPLCIEAKNKQAAIDYLAEELESYHPQLLNIEVVDIKVQTPVYGITEKTEKGINYVWAGYDQLPAGWMIKDDFLQLKPRNE